MRLFVMLLNLSSMQKVYFLTFIHLLFCIPVSLFIVVPLVVLTILLFPTYQVIQISRHPVFHRTCKKYIKKYLGPLIKKIAQ